MDVLVLTDHSLTTTTLNSTHHNHSLNSSNSNRSLNNINHSTIHSTVFTAQPLSNTKHSATHLLNCTNYSHSINSTNHSVSEVTQVLASQVFCGTKVDFQVRVILKSDSEFLFSCPMAERKMKDLPLGFCSLAKK